MQQRKVVPRCAQMKDAGRNAAITQIYSVGSNIVLPSALSTLSQIVPSKPSEDPKLDAEQTARLGDLWLTPIALNASTPDSDKAPPSMARRQQNFQI